MLLFMPKKGLNLNLVYESVYTTYISIEIECTYHKLPKFLTKVSFLKLPNFKEYGDPGICRSKQS